MPDNPYPPYNPAEIEPKWPASAKASDGQAKGSNTNYDPGVIEPKWQKEWEKSGLNSPDIKGAKKPFYNLTMFPYPSAEGLHVGNMYAFVAGDIYGRFKKLQGYDVFEPIGLDGFGIHSENFALKIGRHPKDHAARTEKHFYEQLHQIGNMYDWTHTVETYNPNYYKWTQWLFLQMYKAGLAYRGKANVNFCPKDKTVLSDEQVIDGKCERCGTEVEKRELEQWFFKITKYADRLLEGHKNLDWSKKVIVAQKNWIGKKEGALIKFPIVRHSGEAGRSRADFRIDSGCAPLSGAYQNDSFVEIFTTRPETILGATFVVLSPNHPLANKVKFVINPATKKEIPVFVDEYVLDSVGTGAIMGVPAHDERDLAFAKKHNLPIVKAPTANLSNLTNLTNPMVIYHLRDWSVSRQRYWGPPIPMIFCPSCAKASEGKENAGWQPVPEDQLPVLLPDIEDYVPEGNGKGPLEKHPEFYRTTCPVCGGEAKRETDVSDVFVDSAWYFLRYPTVGLPDADIMPFDKKITKKWLPVDMYTGGPEHAVLHLMYARFVTMVLKDQGFIDFEEPFKKFFAHGMLIKDGAKMSKSKGNVINPDEYIQKFGADAVRLYLSFMGPVENGGDFRDASMHGMRKWVERVYRVISDQIPNSPDIPDSPNPAVENELNRLIKKAEEDFESRHYNTTIAKMMEFLNYISSEKAKLSPDQIKKFLIVLAPFAPHLTEELYHVILVSEAHPESDSGPFGDAQGEQGRMTADSIHQQSWPKVNEANLSEEAVTIIISINGKPRGTMEIGKEEERALGENRLVQKAQTSDSVAKYLKNIKVKKIVYVPGKIINFVV